MASKTQRSRVLTGAMSLLPPQDKLPEGDSLQLDNFKVDLSTGELRSRLGAVLMDNSPVGSGLYHTLARNTRIGGDDARYSGIGTELYFGPQPARATLISGGFDGQKIGLAFYQGHGWAINRSKQIRIEDDVARPYFPKALTTAPVAALDDETSIEMEEFDDGSPTLNVQTSNDGVTWEQDVTDGAATSGSLCTASYDDVNKQSGAGSLSLVCNEPQTVLVQVKLGAAIDTRTSGVARDADKFLLWVYLSDPKAVRSVTVTLRNAPAAGESQGLSVEAHLVAGTSWDPAMVFNQAAQSWTEIGLRRILNIDSFQQRITEAAAQAKAGTLDYQLVTDLTSQLSQFLRQPALQVIAAGDPQILSQNNVPAQQASDFDWSAVTEIDVTFVLSASCEIHLDRARFTANVGVSLSGDVAYYITVLDDILHESNPSPVSNDLIVNNQPVKLTNIPVSQDPDLAPHVRGRRIYRIGGGLSQALQVGTLWDNSTTTWSDTTSVDQATADGIQMPFDHDGPPAARGVVGPFFGKLIAFSTAAHPSRVFWTKAAEPAFFPGSADEDIGNWEDAGADDDELLMITDHKQRLILYKQRSVWLYPGDPEKVSPVKTNANIGLVGPNAVVNAGAVDYLVGPEGVYVFNGDFETKISQAIDPIFKGDWTRLNSVDAIPPIDATGIVNCAIGLIGDRLRVCYPEAGRSVPNVILICHLSTGRWEREKYTGLPAPAFTVMNYEGPGRYMMAGFTGGYLYILDAIGWRGDNGAAFHAVWQSGFLDQGLPDNRKVYSDLEITFKTAYDSVVSTLSVYAVYDTDNAYGVKSLLGTISANARSTLFLRIQDASGNVGVTAKNIAIRIECDVQAVVAIYAVYLHWYPEERLADSFDSGPTDFAIPERVKEIDYVEMFLTAQGQQVSRLLTSDLPGSLMTVRETTLFAAPNGRGNVRFRLASVIDGRNFRLQTYNTPFGPAFQMHQARVRMRPIGEYIDGTLPTPEFYESPEFSVAPGRVGELKDFLLDYDVSGPGGLLVIYSDMPGGALAVRRTLQLPAQTTRGIYVFPLESAIDVTTDTLPAGQLFKARLYPPPGGILRLHGRAQFRARVIGVYFAGGNGEVWATQPLDLFGGMSVYREISIEAQTAGPMLLDFQTELPGQDMQTVATFTLNPSSSTAGRLPVYFRLKGNAKGRLQLLRVRGNYETRIFSVKLLGRRLEVNGGGWEWKPVPLEPTPDAWANIQMPVRSTPEAFEWRELAVDPIE